jgi:glycosyltransferase involved in cell wall biosynthesis
MKISVVMAAYLGEYTGCASNRIEKFKRAVDSFIYQTYSNCELIIVSDGCDITESLYNLYYINYDNILFTKIEKDITFGGSTRNTGLEIATGTYVCYLDTDDFLSRNHLKNIVAQITDHDWYYYDDCLLVRYNNNDDYDYKLRINIPRPDRIGTSSIIHKKNNNKWESGYAHDWKFICKLIENNKNFTKINIEPSYNVCHIPNKIDL